MANSTSKRLLNPLMGEVHVPARSRGPLGFMDQGDPNTTAAVSDTPGPLGNNDWGAPWSFLHTRVTPWTPICRSRDGVAIVRGRDKPGLAKAAGPDDGQIDIIVEGLKNHSGAKIGRADYEQAAKELKCEPEVLMAIGEQESGKLAALGLGAFDKQNRPTILFERHVFSKETGGRFNASNPDISSGSTYLAGTARGKDGKRFDDGNHYGLFSWQYRKLARAYALDRDAALSACSWGKFQIMGHNYAICGYSSVRAFVLAMCESEKRHLEALTGYCKTMTGPLGRKDWAAIARAYNGPAYKKNNYDAELKSHYDKFVAQKASK